VRVLCKCYEYLLGLYTVLCRGVESDWSKLLLDMYTKDQTPIQDHLDQALSQKCDAKWELLILIPFRNLWDLTEKCLFHLNSQIIDSQIKMRTFLINNRSVLHSTNDLWASAASLNPKLNIGTMSADYDFNYSILNNEGFRRFASSKTKRLLCLNNDVEVLDRTILQRMLNTIECLPEVGVVGCSLLYPSRRIQHLFVTPGVKIIAAHPLRGHLLNPNILWFAKPASVVPAVTDALMLVRNEDFIKVGMIDENLPLLG